MRRRRIIRAGLAFLASFIVGAALLPGPMQALAPRWNGLAEIAPGVFLDDLEKAAALRADLVEAEARVAAFFGEPQPHARTIFAQRMPARIGSWGTRDPPGGPTGRIWLLWLRKA